MVAINPMSDASGDKRRCFRMMQSWHSSCSDRSTPVPDGGRVVTLNVGSVVYRNGLAHVVVDFEQRRLQTTTAACSRPRWFPLTDFMIS